MCEWLLSIVVDTLFAVELLRTFTYRRPILVFVSLYSNSAHIFDQMIAAVVTLAVR